MKHEINSQFTRNKVVNLSATLAVILAMTLALALPQVQSKFANLPANTSNTVGHGDVDTLKTALNNWRDNYEAKGGSQALLKISLGYSKVLSKDFTHARGQMSLNLKNGELNFKATGLDNGTYELWLVDNNQGSVKPEKSDKMLQMGSFVAKEGKGHLVTVLERNKLLGFTLNTIIVTKAGNLPLDSITIAGAPDLMHKLYYAEKPWLSSSMGDLSKLASETPASFAFMLPKAAQADTIADLTPVLGALVAQGRQIFHNETFEGNGRTCGTCHRADNNFTLDPNYIMKLPPTDPLFVAETNPALSQLENPILMRKHGLILTNVDGPGVDIFRSVPHVLSLATTTKSETKAIGGDFAADEAFAAATGWSGDGATGSGSLREFTLGAVAQHLTKTMFRTPNSDFRVPNDFELDAVEAYLLSLGRSKDYPVYKLTFNDPLIQAGKALFDTKQNPCTNNTAQGGNPATCPSGQTVVQGNTANCNGCHQNAGGRSSTTNANPTRDTGIERMKILPARLLKPDMAYDGGFGTNVSTCGSNGAVCYGDGRFNTPPLIEAADTGPFFHNNVVSTLEEAIASYNSDSFNSSPGSFTSKLADRRGKLDSTQVVAVASFLRAINALENIRQSDRLDNQAKQISNNSTARELAKLAIEENLDAMQVLKEGMFGTNWRATKALEQASYYQNLAQLAPLQTLRNALLQQALNQKLEARNLIASCNQSAAAPSTVVVPPAGNQYDCSEIGF